jgi:hypothetical protein
MSVAVVRTFVEIRQMLVYPQALAEKLTELDAKVGTHDEQLAAIIEAIRELTRPAEPEHTRRIGFHPDNR